MTDRTLEQRGRDIKEQLVRIVKRVKPLYPNTVELRNTLLDEQERVSELADQALQVLNDTNFDASDKLSSRFDLLSDIKHVQNLLWGLFTREIPLAVIEDLKRDLCGTLVKGDLVSSLILEHLTSDSA